MSKEKKVMILWHVVGVIFLSVCIRDLFNSGASTHSIIFAVVEGIAGIACIVNAFSIRRKYISDKDAF